ncbi:MAG: 1-acyl-sn-glycerol-3-phosphate acyltransferase [Flavobacteriia bacterium]|jgi:1-acyl-sn-glycerol-3-phosphate acyltransferase|nr:1-acyl-sn-glycerol-3-phosphate acyltransferase [Flavobacteriia bacterium]NBP28224.1 1-acyl-sn-glycerol-3-phosphate acyltransferase [Flavobacteriia bacterium]
MRYFLGSLSLLWKVYIALVFFFWAIVLFPFFIAIVSFKKTKKYGFNIFIFWSYAFRFFCIYPIRKVLHAPLPEGPYIIVANHTSYLDIFFMYSILPKYPFMFMGKSEILKYPIVRTYFKNMNVPVDRSNKSRSTRAFMGALKAYREGYALAIFPEATFPTENLPHMLPFKAGAFKLAKQLGAPILPLTFTNNYLLFSEPTIWLGPARPGLAVVHIHPVISAEEVNALSETELLERCFSTIEGPLK